MCVCMCTRVCCRCACVRVHCMRVVGANQHRFLWGQWQHDMSSLEVVQLCSVTFVEKKDETTLRWELKDLWLVYAYLCRFGTAVRILHLRHTRTRSWPPLDRLLGHVLFQRGPPLEAYHGLVYWELLRRLMGCSKSISQDVKHRSELVEPIEQGVWTIWCMCVVGEMEVGPQLPEAPPGEDSSQCWNPKHPVVRPNLQQWLLYFCALVRHSPASS